jgi:osmotically inducible protein OsmC
MIRQATAVWSGGLKDGKGNVTTGSKALSAVPYDFKMRFEEAPGTNPEELIAAAHAGCFSMALSGELGKANITAQSIQTVAHITMEPVDGKPTVTASRLVLTVKAPGADRAAVQAAADGAKAGCPISRLLSNLKITLETTIEV